MLAGVPIRAWPFVFFVCAGGVVCLLAGTIPWHSSNELLLFGSYLVLTAVASALKAVMPGLEGTVSVNLIFFLVGACSMTLSETLTLALVATVVQCFWRRKSLHVIQFVFNVAQVALAITAAFWTYNVLAHRVLHGRTPLALLIAAIVYFLLNTIPVATVIALTEGIAIGKKWTTGYAWTFPYYLVGAAIAGVIQLISRLAGWEMSILVLPAVYAVYRSFRTQLGRWEDEKRHLQDIASLNMRTIETLALAIKAKDHTTGDHLQRVRVYALELAKDLQLTPSETDALKAASVLHDIGKLAVPEHIISKPGKLTPEEFAKMKIHPVVGAEILEQVRFPYPVAPIVRSHHEKWDGSGYPDGLSGEAIPIGARILSAVDCLDALASDRQYRPALPLDEAMSYVEREAGKAFDPRVVAALKARYIELEELAQAQELEELPSLSTDMTIERGAAPDAGFGISSSAGYDLSSSYSTSEAFSLTKALDSFDFVAKEAFDFEEALSAAAVRLQHVVPFDAMAVFACSNDVLIPCFACGENMRQLRSLRVRLGKGLVGWVAETGEAILNGNPMVEPGFATSRHSQNLGSALAIPLMVGQNRVGVIALYRLQPDSFTAQSLEKLRPIAHQIAQIEAAWQDRENSPHKLASFSPAAPVGSGSRYLS